MCRYTHTHIHIHAHSHIHTHVHSYTHMHTLMHIHIYMNTYTHIYTYIHTCTYIHMHTHTCLDLAQLYPRLLAPTADSLVRRMANRPADVGSPSPRLLSKTLEEPHLPRCPYWLCVPALGCSDICSWWVTWAGKLHQIAVYWLLLLHQPILGA